MSKKGTFEFTTRTGDKAIVGRSIRGQYCKYYVGATLYPQPSIAIQVDGSEFGSQVTFDYDKASLKAAELLVKEIKRGIKERNNA
jgi:hypothetical protein